jgi:hypothetical protein
MYTDVQQNVTGRDKELILAWRHIENFEQHFFNTQRGLTFNNVQATLCELNLGARMNSCRKKNENF